MGGKECISCYQVADITVNFGCEVRGWGYQGRVYYSSNNFENANALLRSCACNQKKQNENFAVGVDYPG